MRQNLSQGAEWSLLSVCLDLGRCFLVLRAPTLGYFAVMSVEVTTVLPGEDIAEVFPVKSCCSPQHQPRCSDSENIFKLSRAEKRGTPVRNSRAPPAEGPTPVPEQIVTALRWPLSTSLHSPQLSALQSLCDSELTVHLRATENAWNGL